MLSDTPQQLTLTVVIGLSRHRTVQIKQQAIHSACQCNDGIAHIGKGIVLHRPAWRCPSGNTHFDVDLLSLGHLYIAAEARGGSAVGLQGGLAFQRLTMAAREALEIGNHGRKGIGLMTHHSDANLHNCGLQILTCSCSHKSSLILGTRTRFCCVAQYAT